MHPCSQSINHPADHYALSHASAHPITGLPSQAPAVFLPHSLGLHKQVVQSWFVSNSAGLAGGLHVVVCLQWYASAGQVHLHSCLFTGNVAESHEGGAVFVDSVSSMLIDSCSFINRQVSCGELLTCYDFPVLPFTKPFPMHVCAFAPSVNVSLGQ